jgi:hypothetical protein
MSNETPGIATTADRLDDSKFTEWGFQSNRVDRDWEIEEANRRREDWSDTQSALAAELSKTRELQPVDERLADIANRIWLRASGYVWNEKLDGDLQGTRKRGGLEVEYMSAFQLTKHLEAASRGDADAIHHIRILEKMLDGQRTPGNQIRLTTDLDNRILELEGLSPEQISTLDPQLGAPKVIRNVRRLAGLNTQDGTSKEAVAA